MTDDFPDVDENAMSGQQPVAMNACDQQPLDLQFGPSGGESGDGGRLATAHLDGSVSMYARYLIAIEK